MSVIYKLTEIGLS